MEESVGYFEISEMKLEIKRDAFYAIKKLNPYLAISIFDQHNKVTKATPVFKLRK